MDPNYFDPDTFSAEGDPMRVWAQTLESDPELVKLLATDPQSAITEMQKRGIPPPPGDLQSYAEGGLGDERSRTQAVPTQIIGGADPIKPTPVATEKVPPLPQAPAAGSPFDRITRLLGSTWGPQGAPPMGNGAGEPLPTPLPTADPRKALASALDPVGADSPPIMEPEPNPSAGQPLVPRPRPVEAGATDISAQSRTGEALGGFGKSLQGVRPSAAPPPNFVSTPSVRSPGSISAPNLQNLLSLVGQPAPSPLGLTLGRLLATGKA